MVIRAGWSCKTRLLSPPDALYDSPQILALISTLPSLAQFLTALGERLTGSRQTSEGEV